MNEIYCIGSEKLRKECFYNYHVRKIVLSDDAFLVPLKSATFHQQTPPHPQRSGSID